jgi:DNA-binding NtrC family response regulator
LRERPEDIPPLLERFLPAGTRERLDPMVMAEILGRPWLGNVRELRNFAERLLTFGAGDALAMDAPPGRSTPAPGALPYREARERALDQFERTYVRDLLARHQGNVAAAAEAAEMNRAYLYRLVARQNG